MGCSHPMVSNQVVPGLWYQCNQFANEIQRREQHVGGAIAVGMLQLILNLTVIAPGQAIETDGRPGDIPAQTFKAVALVWLAGNSRIE